MTNITHNIVKSGLCLICAALTASAVWAQASIPLPQGVVETGRSVQAGTSFDLPIGAWSMDAGVPQTRIQGTKSRQTFILKNNSLSALELMNPIKAQLTKNAYDIILECQGRECGGFDFRNRAPIAKPPEMFLDLRNYAVLTATSPDTGNAVFIVTTVFAGDGYIQLDQITAGTSTPATHTVTQSVQTDTVQGTVAEQLHSNQRAILSDLEFPSGSSTLDQKPFDSLRSLAEFMSQNPETQILLVGHSDMMGSMDGNMALSRNRAQSVRNRLIAEFGINDDRLRAYGVGFLSPIVSNATSQGRDQNRRVEAIVKHDGQ